MNNITKTITTSGCALNIKEDPDIKILHEYYTRIPCIGEAFDKIADEWREMKCSFYQTTNKEVIK